MLTINFPLDPLVDDTYEFEGKKWTYNGIGWVLVVNGLVPMMGVAPLDLTTLR